MQDTSEAGLAGVPITLLRRDSIFKAWTTHRQTTSGSSGYYSFTSLSPGEYRVNFGNKTGYRKTFDNAGSDETKDSEAWAGAAFTLYAGQNRTDIDGGYIADSQRESAYFQLAENSPNGTIVGSVGDTSRFYDYSLTSPWFEVSDQGVITVKDSFVLDYERSNPRFEFPVVAFGNSGISSNVVFDVIVDLINVNEGPEYDQGTQLQANVLQPVTLQFKDPEGDSVVSVSGNPQHGKLVLPSGSTSVDAFWVPYSDDFLGATPASGDSFGLTASDGNASGDETQISISVTGTPNFGRFELGSNPPTLNKETEPGAIGRYCASRQPSCWSWQ